MTAYEPHRDDRFEYAGEAIESVESNTCRLGCWLAGSEADIAEHGPGGTCGYLAGIFTGEIQPEIQDHGDAGLFCTAREDRNVHPQQLALEITA